MLLFCRDKQGSKASPTKADNEDLLSSTYTLRVATACLLLSFWVVWITALVQLAFFFSLWPIDICLSSVECSSLSVILLLLGTVLLVGTIGWMWNSPMLTTLLIVPPITFAGAASSVMITFWIFDIGSQFKYDFTAFSGFCFLCFWVFVIYIVMIIQKYCKYLKDLERSKKRKRSSIDVFKESFLGTPPLIAFNRMEFARCSSLSDSIPDDIFADGYELDVVLE